MSVRARFNFFEVDPAALLHKFGSSLDSDLGVGTRDHRPDEMTVGVSNFRRLKWETLTWGLQCAHKNK